jgi:hypothetical protein
VIVNAVFTGDAELHEAEIRKVWDGPLCVVARDVPTARELARIRKEVGWPASGRRSRRASTTSGSRCTGRRDPLSSR